jgi:catechol 2,3-dioxygenase
MHVSELGHAVLYVRDIIASSAFYREVLGFPQIHRTTGIALFSGGRTHHELLLIEVGGEKKDARFLEPGLYHLGFKIGNSLDELKDAYQELVAHGVTIVGSGDHTVTNSLYILDPDGNELELYVDVSDAWKEDPSVIMAPVKPLSLT